VTIQPSAGRLATMTWPAVAEAAGAWLLAIPVGSTEQHGPHLPLATDALVAETVAARLARARSDVVVAPALAYGASGEHAAFAGTLSIGMAALRGIIVELVRSADAFAGSILVNGHGGNHDALAAAADQLRAEGRRVLVWSPNRTAIERAGPFRVDAHAGRFETSIMLAIAPEMVRMDRAEAGDPRPVADLLDIMRRDGIAGVTRIGVLGDPAGATAEEGEALLVALTHDLVDAVAAWTKRAGTEPLGVEAR